MIILGMYDEFEPGLELPSIYDYLESEPYEGQDRIVDYLKHKGKIHMTTCAFGEDLFTGKRFGIINHMNDGDFSWSTVIPYYVEKYNLRLPKEFEDKVLRGVLVPEKVKEQYEHGYMELLGKAGLLAR